LRRLVFCIGLLMILGGLYISTQGVQILTPVAEITGLVSHQVSVTPIVASTLLSVPATNYSFISADLMNGLTATGSLQVEGGSEIGFYIMNANDFSEWKRGSVSTIVLGKPDAINYNFTFVPQETGLYYFVFSNQDPSHKNVIFNLSVLENVTVLSPLIQYADYELLIVGVFLSILGIKTGKRKPKIHEVRRENSSLRCRFCGEGLETGKTFCSKCGRSQD